MFSKEALRWYVDKKEIPIKRKQLKIYAVATIENTARLSNSYPLRQRGTNAKTL